MESCEGCGLPSWAVSSPGKNICLDTKASKFRRASRKTVWVCSRNCDICARAVAVMGPSSHRWPITLGQFASLPEDTGLHGGTAMPEQFMPKDGQTVTKTSANRQRLRGSQRGLKAKVTLPHQKQVKGSTAVKSGPRKGGRPRVENPLSPAQRMRAYRQRVSESLLQVAG